MESVNHFDNDNSPLMPVIHIDYDKSVYDEAYEDMHRFAAILPKDSGDRIRAIAEKAKADRLNQIVDRLNVSQNTLGSSDNDKIQFSDKDLAPLNDQESTLEIYNDNNAAIGNVPTVNTTVPSMVTTVANMQTVASFIANTTTAAVNANMNMLHTQPVITAQQPIRLFSLKVPTVTTVANNTCVTTTTLSASAFQPIYNHTTNVDPWISQQNDLFLQRACQVNQLEENITNSAKNVLNGIGSNFVAPNMRKLFDQFSNVPTGQRSLGPQVSENMSTSITYDHDKNSQTIIQAPVHGNAYDSMQVPNLSVPPPNMYSSTPANVQQKLLKPNFVNMQQRVGSDNVISMIHVISSNMQSAVGNQMIRPTSTLQFRSIKPILKKTVPNGNTSTVLEMHDDDAQRESDRALERGIDYLRKKCNENYTDKETADKNFEFLRKINTQSDIRSIHQKEYEEHLRNCTKRGQIPNDNLRDEVFVSDDSGDIVRTGKEYPDIQHDKNWGAIDSAMARAQYNRKNTVHNPVGQSIGCELISSIC